jgi:hypothetical protein
VGPSGELLTGAANRGVEVVCGNVAALGGVIGCNDGEFEDFQAAYALARYFSRAYVLPKPLYLMRSLPIRVTQGHMSAFDARLRGAVLSRLSFPCSPPLSLPRVGWGNCASAAEGCVCGLHVA